MLQYSADRVSLSWQGFDLTPGLAAGSFFVPTGGGDTFTEKPDGLGGVVRFRKPGNDRGTLAVLITGTHEVHQALLLLAEADKLTRAIRGPLVLQDRSSGEIITYSAAYLTTTPDDVRGSTAAAVTWVFAYTAVKRKPLAGVNNSL